MAQTQKLRAPKGYTKLKTLIEGQAVYLREIDGQYAVISGPRHDGANEAIMRHFPTIEAIKEWKREQAAATKVPLLDVGIQTLACDLYPEAYYDHARKSWMGRASSDATFVLVKDPRMMPDEDTVNRLLALRERCLQVFLEGESLKREFRNLVFSIKKPDIPT